MGSRKICLSEGIALCFLLSLAHAQSPRVQPTENPTVNPTSNPMANILRGKNCEIWEDPQKLSHLRADHQEDAIACLGFIHGRDRAWQMDFLRRTAEGRKAEIIGISAIESDFVMRLLQLRERAANYFQKIDKKDQDILWAYAQGVNQGIRAALKNGNYEFQEMGYTPDPWKPEDSLSLILLQSFDQTRRSFQMQLDERKWAKKHGENASHLFSTEGLPWDSTILKSGEYPTGTFHAFNRDHSNSNDRSPTQHKETALSYFSASSDEGSGSNSWVLNPTRSRSKNAWLANDPHLSLGYPPFWEWTNIRYKDVDAVGAFLPGVPILVSGTNRFVSWGLTNSFLPAARVSLVSEKELGNAKTIRPWIWVKLWKFKFPFFFKTFRVTPADLPILPIPDAPDKEAFVLNWTGFNLEAKDFRGFFELLEVKTAAEADRVLAQVGIPSWNFVFSDIHGGIGYRAVGRIARFEKNPSFGVPSLALEEVESLKSFTNPLQEDEMPHLLNPKRGFIVTANNPQWPSDSQWSSGSAHRLAFRAYRIEQLLSKKKEQDLKTIQEIQCDLQAVDATFLLPQLLPILRSQMELHSRNRGEDSGRVKIQQGIRKALETLEKWNYQTDLHCIACGVYRLWVENIYSDLLLDAHSLYRILKTGSHLDQAIYTAFLKALDSLSLVSPNELPEWQKIHFNFFSHLAGNEYHPAIPLPTEGDQNSVNPGTSKWNGKYFDQSAGASQRLVVEMSQPPRVFAILPGPNRDEAVKNLSDPASSWLKWRNCELQEQVYPLDWSKAQGKIEVKFE